MDYYSKELVPFSSDAIPEGVPIRCTYAGCTNTVTKIVRNLVDGDLESIYFVCGQHERYEDISRLLDS